MSKITKIIKKSLSVVMQISPQKVLWTAILLIVLMCFFPPRADKGEFLGYAFLFSDVHVGGWDGHYTHIDTVRLGIQMVIVALIAAGLIYTLKDKAKINP